MGGENPGGVREITTSMTLFDLVAIGPTPSTTLTERFIKLLTNVRILLINFAFSYIVEIFSRYMIIGPLLDVYLSTNMESGGSILWCRFAHGLNNTSDFVGSLDMIVLVLERIVATLKYRTYEEQNSPLIGICLIIVQTFVLLLRINRRRYENATSNLYDDYLSKKFQTAENILALVHLLGQSFDIVTAAYTVIFRNLPFTDTMDCSESSRK
ncbi:serpentine type 7TM GPCR receptor class ab chemoreceptor domain-containing protein [Ditylenchus destructor]|nr:serpentine type 7TM GPCR receptor class ab chemoreceptor domain-containing protein [Ditylenchus destructor]